MKTITNIIITNSQNVESEYLLAVIITSVSKKKALSPSGQVPQKSPTLATAKTATGLPEIPQTPVNLTACNTSYCIE